MKVAFYTLGCKVNQYETDVIRTAFLQAGYALSDANEQADIYIVNSCTVTHSGDNKTLRLLRKIRRQNPDAVLVLTGCFPQAFPENAVELADADIITGTAKKAQLVALVEQYLVSHRAIVRIDAHGQDEEFEPMQVSDTMRRTRAFVKIEDGCDRYCAYCIIPTARGRVRSKPIDDLRKELRTLANSGYKEVVLSGINLSLYGREFGLRLIDAVHAAQQTDGIERIRLGSLEPDLLDEEVIKSLAQISKLCPHFHLSLQSGCDATLARMGRRYTTAQYADVVKQLRAAFDGCAITTDIMVGFPGETEEEFARSMAFAQEIDFAMMHVFSYSQRSGTAAAEMQGQLSSAIKSKRSKAMQQLAAQMRAAFLAKQVGQETSVLFESQIFSDGQEGHTPNYTPVRVPQNDLHGAIKCVKIISTKQDYCIGELVEPT